MSELKRWFIILRAYSWPASVVPLSIAGVYAYVNGWFKAYDFLLVFIAGFLIHLSGNLFNTYYDFINNVDRDDADDIGLVKNMTDPKTVLTLAWVFLGFALVVGIYFLLRYSLWLLLPIALLGLLLTIFYTANPFHLKYHALGELVIFLCFGPLLVCGSVMIFAKQFVFDSLLYSLPTAFLIVNILLANNMRDEVSDKKAGIKTLVHIIGIKNSIILYLALHLLSYALSFFLTGFNLIYLLPLPLTLIIFKLLKNKLYSHLTYHSARFVLVYGIVFIVAILW